MPGHKNSHLTGYLTGMALLLLVSIAAGGWWFTR